MSSIRFSLFVFPWLISVVAAQVVKSDGPKPQFEVASVRPNNSGEANSSIRIQPGGRLTATNQTLRNLIRNAFNLQPDQMIGGPDWMDSDRYDIVAKIADADLDAKGLAPGPEFMLRVQWVLEERFKMATHWETRDLPVYALVVATEGKLGPKLKAHTGDCDRARGGGPPPPGSPPMNCGTRSNMTPAAAKVIGSGISMVGFARNLAGETGRNVVDKTGLAGSYDLELEFTPDQSADNVGPSLFTAIQEQLGLKLDSQRAPIEVLVIDKLEKPTPD
jgi:uncharacterized protein (TIGR03435 family)